MLTRSSPMKRRVKPTGPEVGIVAALCYRADYCCEICSERISGERGAEWHVHHRRPRAMGGSNRADTNHLTNLLLLCASCHQQVESRRAEALEHGWLVPQSGNPATVAVLITRDRYRYLTLLGEYSLHPPMEAA